MQHPRLLCYTTIEIDVSRHSIETRFKDHNDLHNPLAISEIVRRCHSIPVTLRALLAKYRTAASVESTGGVKKRGGGGSGGGSDGSGSSDDHMDNDDACDDSKPSGGFTNGRSGAGLGGGGGVQSSDDCMDQDANHHNNDDDACNANDGELHVAPRSLITHDHNGLVYTTLPNR